MALVSPLFESVPPRMYGGTERVVYNLCRGLTDSDIEVTLFASGDSTAEGRLVPVIDEAIRLRKNPVVEDPSAYNLKMLAMIADRADEFDVIHNHHDYWMLPLSEMITTPLLTTLHGRLDLPDIAQAFMAYPDVSYVSISDAQRVPMPWLNWARTVHHGLDTSGLAFTPKSGKYLAFLGRMDLEKRPDWAIEIARRSGVPLKMAAKIEGRKMREFYESRVKPHVDGRFIEYVGEIGEGEKSEFLGGALATVFPIDWPEPFGLVMMESLACGTPVLARPRGSVPELLKDGVTGFCRNEVAELARLVPEAARIDRTGCRNWVEDRFSLKRMTEDYIDVYRRLVEASRLGAGVAKGRRTHRHRRHLLHPVQRVTDGHG